MNTLLELSNVSSGYGSQTIIKSASLSVPDGKLVALIGPNGHGKTTLLRTISGLIPVREGTITFSGTRVDRLRADQIVENGIVHVPQGDMLFPGMSVVENLRMGAYLPAAGRNEKRKLEEIFSLLPKLRDRQNQIAGTLSGGERRMVGIGRGLMADAKLLMLDEPSLGLAPIIIDQIYSVIKVLRDTGLTILIVEENATRISEIADELHLLDNGEFIWRGNGVELMASSEILNAYLGG